MNCKLSVLDRAVLIQSLPQEGNFITLRTLRKLKERFALTPEEIKIFDMKYMVKCPSCGDINSSLNLPIDCPKCKIPMQETGSVTWNISVPQDRDFSFDDSELNIIKSSLKKLNDTNQLTEKHFVIYEKFVGE